VKRRELLLLLGSAMMTAPGVRAQQKAVPVIGFLGVAFAGCIVMAAFRQGLGETGYIEGQNLAIEYRWSEGRSDQLPALAGDLIARKVDVIVTIGGTLPALAVKNPSSTIPIVFVTGADPVAAGLVASLARPRRQPHRRQLHINRARAALHRRRRRGAVSSARRHRANALTSPGRGGCANLRSLPRGEAP
jgi:hypothetical protein